MMKKLFSLFVVLALVLSMIPAVYADGTSFKITPSAAAAEIGDTVEFTVTASGTGLTAAQFEVSIPEGLTFVEGSGAVPADLKSTLGWAGIDWTESSMMWTGYNDVATDIPANTVILTFSCVVEAEGGFDVALVKFEVFDADFSEVEVDASGAVETVEGTLPATPDEPVVEPEATPDEPTGDNDNVDDNKPEQKPEDNKPDVKPEDDNKPEQKPEDNKPEQKPEDEKEPEQKPEDEKEPEQKPEDEKKPEADDKVEENPKTSGNSAIVTFVVMMVASCAVLFTVLMGKKKFMA